MKKSSIYSKDSIKNMNVGGLNIPYEVENRNVIYPRLEFKKNKILVILPKKLKNEKNLLRKKSKWITRKQMIINKAVNRIKERYGNGYIVLGEKRDRENFSEGQLRNILRINLEKFIEKSSKNLNVTIKNFFIRKQKTKWASYSERGNVNFNLKLVHLPKNLIEYVVYHELTHAKEANHTRSFWKHIEKRFPNYQELENLLLGFWFYLDDYS